MRDVLIGAHSAGGRRACGARHDGLGSNGKIRCTMTAEKKRKKRQTKKKKDGPSCAGGIGTSKSGRRKEEKRRKTRRVWRGAEWERREKKLGAKMTKPGRIASRKKK